MTAIAAPRKTKSEAKLRLVPPRLEPGDHLDQKTFHERYLAMPSHVRAELIRGVVYMPSPLQLPHSDGQLDAIRWMLYYHDSTPGVLMSDNATVILGPDDEPQPDLTLRIAPHLGGQTREIDRYINGAPELVFEVASSSESVDLFEKRLAYAERGVQEYVAHAVRSERIYWFIKRNGVFEPLETRNGIYRSEVFPGLWLDAEAMIRRDRGQVIKVLRQGLASKEYKKFAAKLRAAKPI